MNKKLLNKYAERLKVAGLKITPQRLEVLMLYDNKMLHPTADEVWRRLRRKFPSISKATVYNILEIFAERGIISIMDIGKEAHFDFDTSFHAHFICNRCGKIYDVKIDENLHFCLPEEHKVENIKIYFYGICKNCLDREKK